MNLTKVNTEESINTSPPHRGVTKLKPTKNPEMKKKTFKMWSAFAILLLIITVLIFISWILKWTGVTTEIARVTQWDPNTGEAITTVMDKTKILAMGIVDLFVAPMNGFISKASVIIFILILGAFINVVISSKSLEAFSQVIVSKLKGKEIYAIIPLMIFFSICGTAEGMAEESLGFYMICVPLMIAAGFDKFTGLLIVLLGAGVGVLASTVNPFVITMAIDGLNGSGQSATNMTVGDGLVWRLLCWIIFTAVAIAFVMWYAHRVKKNPQKSVVFSTSEGDKKFFLSESAEAIVMTSKRKLTLIVFGFAFIIMIVYLVGWDSITKSTAMGDHASWIANHIPYLASSGIPGWGNGGLEIVAGFFLISSITLAVINGLGEEKFLKQFMAGTSDILSVCLVIATAAGVGDILVRSHMQELFVNGLASGIGGISSEIGKVIVLFLIFLPLSFLIPSTSGFAVAIFPLIAGTVVSKAATGSEFQQVAGSGSVTAFSFASGILNIITPTSGVVMGAMAISRVDYGVYIKAIWPFILGLVGLSIVMLAIGGSIGGSIA